MQCDLRRSLAGAIVALMPVSAAFADQLAPLPVGPPDGKTLEKQIEALYRSAETFSQTCTSVRTLDVDGGPYGGPEESEQTSRFVFQRPDKVVLETETRTVITDGATVWTVDPAHNRYAEAKVADLSGSDFGLLWQLGVFDLSAMTAYDRLVASEPSQCEADNPRSLDYSVRREARSGEPGLWLTWTSTDDPENNWGKMWVSDQTGAIVALESHDTGVITSYGSDEATEIPFTSTTTITCSEVTINPVLSDTTFRYAPDAEAHKVAELGPGSYNPGPSWEDLVKPTITRGEGSLEELDAQRLVSQRTIHLSGVSGHSPVRTLDANFDGAADILVAGSFNDVFIVLDGVTGERDVVALKGRARSGSVHALVPVDLGDQVGWLAAVDHYDLDDDGRRERATCSLHGADGAQRWDYSPEVPDDWSSEMRIAVGDLNGDRVPEIAVATNFHVARQTGHRSFTIEPKPGVLTIFDLTGKRLTQRVQTDPVAGLVVHHSTDGGKSELWVVSTRGMDVIEIDS